MRKKNDVRKKLNFQRVDRNIIEGDRIYRLLGGGGGGGGGGVGGTVAMNYALAGGGGGAKLAMRKLDIDVETYLKDMTNWWECKLKAEESDDQDRFDDFAMNVNNQTLINVLKN